MFAAWVKDIESGITGVRVILSQPGVECFQVNAFKGVLGSRKVSSVVQCELTDARAPRA